MKKYKGFTLQIVTLSTMILFVLLSFQQWNAEQTYINLEFFKITPPFFWILIAIIVLANAITYAIIIRNTDAVTITSTSEGTSLYIFMSDFLKLSEDQMRSVRNLYLLSATNFGNLMFLFFTIIIFYSTTSNLQGLSNGYSLLFAIGGLFTIIFDILGLIGIAGWLKGLTKKKR